MTEGNGMERWRGEVTAQLRAIEDDTHAIFKKLDSLSEWKSSVESRLAKIAIVFGLAGALLAAGAEAAVRALLK